MPALLLIIACCGLLAACSPSSSCAFGGACGEPPASTPHAPEAPGRCSDAYQPICDLAGDSVERCDSDHRGCLVCTCEPKPKPDEPLPERERF